MRYCSEPNPDLTQRTTPLTFSPNSSTSLHLGGSGAGLLLVSGGGGALRLLGAASGEGGGEGVDGDEVVR